MPNKIDKMLAEARVSDEQALSADEVISITRQPRQMPIKKQVRIFGLIQEKPETYQPPSNIISFVSEILEPYVFPEIKVSPEKVFNFY